MDCVVANAVTVEPVSTAKVPANREKNREFRQIRRFDAIWIPNTRANSMIFNKIPYAKEQGISFGEQGI
jgi:hypothetical protein